MKAWLTGMINDRFSTIIKLNNIPKNMFHAILTLTNRQWKKSPDIIIRSRRKIYISFVFWKAQSVIAFTTSYLYTWRMPRENSMA